MADGNASTTRAELAVQIVKFLGWEPQPGIVACEFVDAEGRTHGVIDKIPIFTADDIGEHSPYPVQGAVRCEVSAHWHDQSGRDLVRIKARDGVETTDGVSEFVVTADLVRLIED